MASRPIYIPQKSGDVMVRTESVQFDWFPGMAASQKQKSVEALHDAAKGRGMCSRPLEVSSKSQASVGVALSAFNLSGSSPQQRRFTVETAFQSSKVFEFGGPFRDLLYGTSREAKQDPRLKDSGRLLSFDFFGTDWSLEPKTAFYDWLYIKTLVKNPDLVDDIVGYDSFTDIEFNPAKSINCQAYSVALFVALQWRNLLTEALLDKGSFLELAGYSVVSNAQEDTTVQPRLV